MVVEREPNKTFHIYEDPNAPTADNPPEEFLEEVKSNIPKRESGHRLPSINPEEHMMESVEHSDIEGEEAAEDRGGAYSASDRHSSDEAIFDDEQNHSSPTTSHSDSISEFPDEAPMYGGTHSHSPYTPVKQRSPFRNPSSVRAMQLDVTPPFNHSGYMASPLSGRYKLSTPSRNGTPRSIRSESTKKKASPKKEYPLVLLHVTLLPITFPYSLELMMPVLPPHIIENYNLLKDKATDTVLERGILVPHPREDYELLEERLLESLELKLPRILQCGHFHLDEEDYESEDDSLASEDGDADICDDCGRRIRDGRIGVGTGHRRWNIKIYAANGLMRAGAWAAAWREMERVDVEIEPWIPEDLRRELDMKRLEQEEAEEQRQREAEEEGRRREAEEESRGEAEEVEEAERQTAHAGTPYQGSTRSLSPDSQPYGNEDLRQRPLSPFPASCHQSQQFQKPQPQPQPQPQLQPHPTISNINTNIPTIPLPTLHQIRHFLLTTDRRNIAIAFLSFIVLLLSLNPGARRDHSSLPSYRYSDEISIASGGNPTTSAAAIASQQRRELVTPVVGCVSASSSAQTAVTIVTTVTTVTTTATADNAGTTAGKHCPYPGEQVCLLDTPPEPQADCGKGATEQD
ncbi:hypothetical protein FGG08_003598 [Glutinoglossum americanum]|uniref:Uncharacterized protein n=1 Tax=Glutinoglossum americanum TaxID=1670608 RepID=A0A9P8I6T8_9PEZI|nr:hypothetical protein FGG08_003598 [Glutinoglossum americanum]